MSRRVLPALVVASALSQGCMGILVEGGGSFLPVATYEGAHTGFAERRSLSFAQAYQLELTVSFYFAGESWGGVTGYAASRQNWGPAHTGTMGGAEIRLEKSLPFKLKRCPLWVSGGYQSGDGGSGRFAPPGGGEPVESSSEGGGGLLAGLVVQCELPGNRRLLPRAFAGPRLVYAGMPGGSVLGLGGTARIGAAWLFGTP